MRFQIFAEEKHVSASILDSMVYRHQPYHGGASKALSQVGDNHPVVVLKNISPARL